MLLVAALARDIATHTLDAPVLAARAPGDLAVSLKLFSHLCGGKRRRPRPLAHERLFSHLCGGKRGTSARTAGMWLFSHLCGGKLTPVSRLLRFGLFSHLCGGKHHLKVITK